jgi:hypothetical protein
LLKGEINPLAAKYIFKKQSMRYQDPRQRLSERDFSVPDRESEQADFRTPLEADGSLKLEFRQHRREDVVANLEPML